ncbi:MAG: hypothetical protein AB1427_00210 [Thermodesulfobacteriota bacterium]
MKTIKGFKEDFTGFKQCTACRFKWSTRDQFLEDPDVELLGYQANFVELLAGFFLFNHSCKTTLAIDVEAFTDLYDGPIFRQRLTGTEQCPEHCLHEDNLMPCPNQCECAFVREIIQSVKTWPKRRAA